MPRQKDLNAEAFSEPFSEKLAWLLLRQYTDIPTRGLEGIPGTAAQKRAAYQEFRNFARQGVTYWEAANSIKGSAAALPYYYSVLNLAKAELVRDNPALIIGQKLQHGLSFVPTKSNSIAGDYLKVVPGVFPMLYEKRTGLSLPPQTKLRIKNLLSLIPEIGLEMQEFGAPRPAAASGYHSVVTDDSRAWVLILMHSDVLADSREPHVGILARHFEPVLLTELKEWHRVFGLSNRTRKSDFVIYQSKETFSRTQDGKPVPDIESASQHLRSIIPQNITECVNRPQDFTLTPSVVKSRNLVIPLDLVRYAAMYYLSSIVRYKPVALDPISQGVQAWLMDSFTREVPHDLLANSIMGIRNSQLTFDAENARTS
ncbi:YaaC family protein [Clavibacter zhangzhiyongii]|uniref:YaaC family protein n=1 Tax=Clavibacter TaxID=1573 RepID=UPI0039E06423